MTPDICEGCSVLLEPVKTYTIEILSVGNAEIEYDFSIHQDNWVYAPDGGVWKCEGALGIDKDAFSKNANVDDILYLTPNLLYNATVGISIDNPEIKNKSMYGEKDSKINDVTNVLEDAWLSQDNSEVGRFCTLIGGGIAFLSILGSLVSIEGVGIVGLIVCDSVSGAGIAVSIVGSEAQLAIDGEQSMIDMAADAMSQGGMYVSVTGENTGLLDMEPWNEKGYVYKVKSSSFYGNISPIDYIETKAYLGV